MDARGRNGQGRVGLRRLTALGSLVSLVLLASIAGAFDADSDGLSDEADAFPCKAGSAAVVFAPSQGDFSVTLFEDQWPGDSDTDFNDAVVASNFIFEMTADGRVRSLRATFNVLALGGVYNNGLGLRLAGVRTQSVASIRQTVGTGQSAVLQPQPTDPDNLTLRLLPNMRELFGNRAGVINSDPSAPAVVGLPVELEIAFSTPQVLSTGDAPFDLYIFRTEAPTHEIHRPQYPGTAEMDQSLFGQGNDGSTLSRHFVDQSGLPYALSLPSLRPWPREGVAIHHLYPNIVQFAASGGTQAQDFYASGIDKDYAFGAAEQPAEAPAPIDPSAWQSPIATQFIGPESIPSDTSCINAWGLSIEFGTSRDTYGYATAVDSSSVIIVGYTKASLSGTNAGLQDIFVAKYPRDQADGVTAMPVWVKQFGGSGNDTARSVAIASNGDIYVAGETRSALQGQSNAGSSDAFLMKLSSDGTHQWTRLLGGAGAEGAQSVVVNSSGVYITGGTTTGTLPGATYSGNTPASFLARYGFDGTRQWTQQYRPDATGPQNYSYATALALDSAGNVYSVGTEHRYSSHPSAASNIYAVKHDASGALLWTQHIGDYGYYVSATDYRLASAFSAWVTGSGELVIGGNWESGSQVSSWNGWTRTAGDGSSDALLVKLASDGSLMWGQSLGSTDRRADYALNVTSDSAGNLYISGYTAGAMPGQTAGGNFDYYAARFSASGVRQWVTQHNTANDDGAFGAYVNNATGALYLIGNTGEISGNPVSFANLYYGLISRHNLGTGAREVLNLTAAVNPVSGRACKAIYDAGQRTSGRYTIDPDGAGTAYAPFDVYCDMSTNGGGWTLVLNRRNNVLTSHTSAALLPSDDSRAITNDKWAALRSISTQTMATFEGSVLTAQLSTLAAANCKALAWDLTEHPIAHDETSGCTGTGMDYSCWFGYLYNNTGYLPESAYFSALSTRPFFSSSTTYYLPTTASMWVR